MPFCCRCGSPTGESDVYCRNCGAPQPAAARRPALEGITPRTASMLCYLPLVGWIPAIVVLASERFRDDRTVRFHAFQGIYLFVVWLIVDWVIGPMFRFALAPLPDPMRHSFFLGGLLKAALFAVWIFMLIKTSQDQVYKLPILGELAERSVAEQR
ncbi:MAG: hypothetical protein RMK57_13935 [Bryobacterales bacterium]|nr:hypothetical protein [Bryobacteraceae bacterium]MDW8355620.1 hypothetical protein [Bryobacterales bacterium]